MEKNLVSIIIVNWNGKKHLQACLPSLAKVKDAHYEIILVDNGSTDDSVEYLKKNFPKVKIVQNEKNLGFAEGNNIGFKKAKGEYILLLNNDTKVTPDFLSKLIKVMERDQKIGVVQPKIVFWESKELQSAGSFLTNNGFLYHHGYGKVPHDQEYNQETPIFSANGACMLAKKEVIKKVGLFDADFFLYFEETDFCWRVWLAGYEIIYVPSAVIYHRGSQSARRWKSSFTTFHSFKNRICSLVKNLGFWELFKILPIHLIFCQLAALGFFMTRRPNAWAIQRAIRWNFSHLGETLEKRKKVQNKIRQISDEEFMSKIKRPVKPLPLISSFRRTGGEYEDE